MKRISFGGWAVSFPVAAFLLWAVFVLTSDLTYVPDDQDETVERCDTPITNAAGGDYERRVTATYEPVEINGLRDANTRVYKVVKDIEETDVDTDARTVTQVESRIVEKGTNLCYRNSLGNWEVTDATFEPVEGGFRMDKNNFELELGETLAGPVKFTTSGKSIELTLSHFIISDGINTFPIGSFNPEVRGALDEGDSSKLRFANAFGGNIADVEYAVENGGFHQNIIINDTISAPVGFDEFNTKLYVYTEINLDDFMNIQGGSVTVRGEAVDAVKDLLLADAGTMDLIDLTAIVDGKEELISFFAESEIIDGEGEKLYADRQLFRDPSTGKVYLVESIILAELSECAYPVVWDYVSKSGTISGNEVWTAKETYYVSNDVTITGEVEIEPGTVIKIEDDKSIIVGSGGKIIAEGEPYNYIVFTSKKDDDSGEDLTPGSSTQGAVRDYDEAINITSNASTSCRISYCKIGYATTGIKCPRDLSTPIQNNIISSCWVGISTGAATTTVSDIHNNLIMGCGSTGIYISLSGTANRFTISNNTIDDCYQFEMLHPAIAILGSGTKRFTLRDNLMTNNNIGILFAGTMYYCYVTNNGYYGNDSDTQGVSGEHNKKTSANDPYDSCAIGSFYLDPTDAANFINGGSRTASAAGLVGDEFTTSAPSTASSTISSNTTWCETHVSTDEGEVDIGYHHNRVQYVLDSQDTTISDAILIIEPGVVVAVHGAANGLKTGQDGGLICIGDPFADDYNIVASKRAVSMHVESALNDYPSQYQNGIKIESTSRFNSVIRYTKFLGLYQALRIERDLPSPVKNNWFRNNTIGIRILGTDIELFNNVFYYNDSAVSITLSPAKETRLYNNTFDNSSATAVMLYSMTDGKAVLYDNLFTENQYAMRRIGVVGTIDNDYNGYYGNTNVFSGIMDYGEHAINDLTESPYDTSASWQEKYKLTQSATPPTLIDAGSDLAYAKKLTPYTTAVDDTIEVDDLDIGFHYANIDGPDDPNPDAPTVSITAPSNNDTVSGETAITIQASDTQGENPGLTQMAIYIDTEYYGTATPDITTCYWRTNTALNGTHRIRAFAFDLDDDVGLSSIVSVNCDNNVTNFSEDKPEFNQNNQEIVIAAMLSESMLWTAEIKGMEGETIRTFGPITSENVTIIWDGKDEEETTVDDGIYPYTIVANIPGGGTESVSGAAIASTVPIDQIEALLMTPAKDLRYDTDFLLKAVNHLKGMGIKYKVYRYERANWRRFKSILRSPSCYIFIFAGHGGKWPRGEFQKTGIALADHYVYDNLDGLDPYHEYTFESLLLSSSPKIKLVYLETCHAGDIGGDDIYANNPIALEFGIYALGSVGGDQSFIAFKGVVEDGLEKVKFVDYFLWYLRLDYTVYGSLNNIILYHYNEVPHRCCEQGVWKGSLLTTYIPPLW